MWQIVPRLDFLNNFDQGFQKSDIRIFEIELWHEQEKIFINDCRNCFVLLNVRCISFWENAFGCPCKLLRYNLEISKISSVTHWFYVRIQSQKPLALWYFYYIIIFCLKCFLQPPGFLQMRSLRCQQIVNIKYCVFKISSKAVDLTRTVVKTSIHWWISDKIVLQYYPHSLQVPYYFENIEFGECDKNDRG